jgi:hypothetical protein
LVKKEIILQKKALWFGFFYSVFLFAAFANPVLKDFTYSMCSFGVAYIALLGIAQAEYKNNSDIVMISLPTTRSEIVGAKYLSVLVCTVIAIVITGVIGLAFSQMPAPFNYRLINQVDIMTAIISVSLLTAVFLPINFKFTAQWLRIVNVLVFMLIFFAPAQIFSYIAKNNSQPWLQSLAHFANYHSWMLLILCCAVILGILLFSYYISLKIYLKKDF